MNDILRILLGEARPRQAADESLFLSGRNYLGVRPPMPNIPPVTGLPPVPPQVGPVAGLVTINDNGQIIKLAPGEVYDGGIRIIPGPAPTFTGLLDTYPGAAAAFSLRRLSVNYTGPLVQVRRASDNDETTIPYKDDGTLDVDVLNAFAAGTDAFVSEWPDQSGNGNDTVQASTASQPKVYDSVTGVVTKDGNYSAYSASGQHLITSNTIGNDGNWLAIAVAARMDATNKVIGLQSSTTLAAQLINYNSTSVQTRGYNGSVVSDSSATFVANTDLQMLGSQLASNSLEALYNGASNGGTALAGQVTTAIELGVFCRGSSGETFNGYISEVVLYATDKSADRAAIEANIATFYGITI